MHVLLVPKFICSRRQFPTLHNPRTSRHTCLGWWFIARSADGEHLMVILTYVHEQPISINYIHHMGWDIADYLGYGCHIFEKDPRSVGPGVLLWGWVYSLGNHYLFLVLNYSIIQPITQHITMMIIVPTRFHSPRRTVCTHRTMDFTKHHISRDLPTYSLSPNEV